QVARLCPFVLGHLDIADGSTPLHLDRSLLGPGSFGVQVEAGTLCEAAGDGEERLRDVLDRGPACLLVGPRDTYSEGLDFGVMPRLILGVARGENEGMGKETDFIRFDEIRFPAKARKGFVAPRSESPLTFLDLRQLGLRLRVARARLFGKASPPVSQI